MPHCIVKILMTPPYGGMPCPPHAKICIGNPADWTKFKNSVVEFLCKKFVKFTCLKFHQK